MVTLYIDGAIILTSILSHIKYTNGYLDSICLIIELCKKFCISLLKTFYAFHKVENL